jgi:hypothetical protein
MTLFERVDVCQRLFDSDKRNPAFYLLLMHFGTIQFSAYSFAERS